MGYIGRQQNSDLKTNGELFEDVVSVSTSNIDSKYLDPKSPLSRLLSEAAYLPYCSWNKQAQQFKPKEYAIRYPYMQVNRPGMVSWLVFDLDHSNSFIWDDEDLPEPNLIVSNRDNGKSHLFYAIVPVCTTENARSHPIQYMRAIVEAMKLRLDADLSYSGPVAKTPGHAWWHTAELHTAVYTLGDLAKYVEAELESKPQWSQGPDLEANSHSRHLSLFELSRFYAYSIVQREREFSSYQSFTKKVHSYAMSKNTFARQGFSSNLTFNQVKATVKSISRWTWDKYTGCGRCNLGVMQLDKSLSLKERQSQSASRTHEIIVNASKSSITAACRMLMQKGEKLTQKAVASASGLSRQTIGKYQYIIKELCEKQTANVITLEDIKNTIKNVKSGAYKITAGFSPSVKKDLKRFPELSEQCEIEDLGYLGINLDDCYQPP